MLLRRAWEDLNLRLGRNFVKVPEYMEVPEYIDGCPKSVQIFIVVLGLDLGRKFVDEPGVINRFLTLGLTFVGVPPLRRPQPPRSPRMTRSTSYNGYTRIYT